jgi:DHA1 family bicyclomycin/chloramphenicol resistance-like MFS transporter
LKLLQQPPFRADTAPSIALLATIAMMGTMALHMVIPVMPAMAADLQASPGVIQMTVTLYLFGLSIGQLIYGPLSDRYGRRPILLGGLALYVLSGLVVATTANAALLLPARIFQALGGCSGLVLGRAMMRDGASGDKVARSMAVLNTALSLGPALSPAVGGYVALCCWWRSGP